MDSAFFVLAYGRARIEARLRPELLLRAVRRVGRVRPLQRWAKRCLRDEAMLHVDADAVFVHPSRASLGIIVEIIGRFRPRFSGEEHAVIRPQLVSVR